MITTSYFPPSRDDMASVREEGELSESQPNNSRSSTPTYSQVLSQKTTNNSPDKTIESPEERRRRSFFLRNIGPNTTIDTVHQALVDYFGIEIEHIIEASGLDTRHRKTGSIDILFTKEAYKTHILRYGITIAGKTHGPFLKHHRHLQNHRPRTPKIRAVIPNLPLYLTIDEVKQILADHGIETTNVNRQKFRNTTIQGKKIFFNIEYDPRKPPQFLPETISPNKQEERPALYNILYNNQDMEERDSHLDRAESNEERNPYSEDEEEDENEQQHEEETNNQQTDWSGNPIKRTEEEEVENINTPIEKETTPQHENKESTPQEEEKEEPKQQPPKKIQDSSPKKTLTPKRRIPTTEIQDQPTAAQDITHEENGNKNTIWIGPIPEEVTMEDVKQKLANHINRETLITEYTHSKHRIVGLYYKNPRQYTKYQKSIRKVKTINNKEIHHDTTAQGLMWKILPQTT